jgi:hypothetical protein
MLEDLRSKCFRVQVCADVEGSATLTFKIVNKP